MPDEEPSRGSLLFDRLMLVGEGIIPKEEFDKPGVDMNVWLYEPDPNQFPPEMQHLIKYLPMEPVEEWEIEEAREAGEEFYFVDPEFFQEDTGESSIGDK